MVRRHLPARVEAVSQARRVVHELCAELGLGAVTDRAELVVGELVTNAVRYGQPPLALEAAVRGPCLYVGVSDGGAGEPTVRRHVPDDAEGGRGLLLVDALTSEWGVRRTEAGKEVWACLPVVCDDDTPGADSGPGYG